MKTLLSFGETLWDLLPAGPVLGGAPCNLAYRVTEQGDRAILVTRLGRDDLGRKAHARLEELGMDASQVQWDATRPTGTVKVEVGPGGSPDFTISRDAAYDFIESSDELLGLAAEADALCFGTLCQRSKTSGETLRGMLDRCRSGVKFLDLNLRRECHTPESVDESLQRADVVKLNEEEAFALAKRYGLPKGKGSELGGALVRKFSLASCVVTLAERGAAAFRANDHAWIPGYKVDVVDACGSGDAFSAGFLHAWLRGRTLREACMHGNALGALAARTRGATTPIGSLENGSDSGPPPVNPDVDGARFWML